MELYIVRHGIAIDREDPKCPADPERFLTDEGLEKSRQVAKGVAEVASVPDLILTSPYLTRAANGRTFRRTSRIPETENPKI